MPITDHQRNLRRSHIGASDSPLIAGLSPWGDAAKVYFSKVYESDDEPTAAMLTGNRLEGPLLDFAEEQLGNAIIRNQFRVSQENGGILAASHDALLRTKREGVEAKYVGPNAVGEWGEPGTDDVPDHVNIQCQHQCHVSELDCVWVVAAIARFTLEWQMFKVPRNDPIIAWLVEKDLAFWHNHVLPKIPPIDCAPPPLEILSKIHRQPETVADLCQVENAVALLEDFQEANAARLLLEKEEKTAKERLLALLGDSEGGLLPDGRMLTYLSQKGQKRVDTTALLAAMPEAAKYVSQSSYRVLRIKEPKK
jgi:predicted phage-related endonuclease